LLDSLLQEKLKLELMASMEKVSGDEVIPDIFLLCNLGKNAAEILIDENLTPNYHRVCWRREEAMELGKGKGQAGHWERIMERGMGSALC
jgi:hypothetical protein